MELRITVEEVLHAYEVTGLKPIRGTYGRYEGLTSVAYKPTPGYVSCGCPLTALHLQELKLSVNAVNFYDLHTAKWAKLKYGETFRDAFTWGVDQPLEHTRERAITAFTRQERIGLEDGRAVRQALLDKYGEF